MLPAANSDCSDYPDTLDLDPEVDMFFLPDNWNLHLKTVHDQVKEEEVWDWDEETILSYRDVESSINSSDELSSNSSFPDADSSSSSHSSNDDDSSTGNYSYTNDSSSTDGIIEAIQQDQIIYNSGNVFHKNLKTYLRIHQYLRGSNCPLGTFDDILAIFKEEALANGFDILARHPSRRTLLKQMAKEFGGGRTPQKTTVALETPNSQEENYQPQVGDTADVYSFDFKPSITHLLTDDHLCGNEDNLSLDLTNPFACPAPNLPLDEVTTGSWYQEAWANMVKEAVIQNGIAVCPKGYPLFMVPLILYVDKTGTSVMQRLGIEPVMFTIAFFKRSIRNKTDLSWRPLGYIPDLDQKSRASKARERSTPAGKGRSCRNYHLCLDVVLQSLIDFQQSQDSTMTIRLGQITKTVSIRCPIAFIIGDTKSQDMLCCRVANYNKQARTCYACYTPFTNLCSPTYLCKYVKQKDQGKLLRDCMAPGKENDKSFAEKLRSVSTIRCYSKSMFTLDYGGTSRGQFGACALDLMHAFESGVCRDVCKAFIDPIAPRFKEQLDKFVDTIFSKQRSTGRNKCGLRTNFSKGITNATLLTSNEWPGLLLTYLIVAQTYQGSKFLDDGRFEEDGAASTFTEEKANRKRKAKSQRSVVFPPKKAPTVCLPDDNSLGEESLQGSYHGPHCFSHEFIQLAEMLLAFHAYYSKSKQFWNQGDNSGEAKLHKAMAVVLGQLTSTLGRGGNGWNTAKTHSTFRHVADLISRFGKATNCDAEVGERGLKGWAKNLAKITNKGSSGNFLGQVTSRSFEANVFSMGVNSITSIKPDTKITGEFEMGPAGMHLNCHFHVTCRQLDCTLPNIHAPVQVQSKWLGQGCVVELQSQILEVFHNLFFDTSSIKHNSENSLEGLQIKCAANLKAMYSTVVEGYTEYVGHLGCLFRAHPNYRKLGIWCDWSIIQCPNDCIDLLRNSHYHSYPDMNLLDPLPGEGPPVFHTSTDNKRRHIGKKTNIKQERPLSWTEDMCGSGYVPAKILSLYVDPHTGVDMALVHACRPWMQKNYDRSSAITECWHLQYIRDEDKQSNYLPLRPYYNIIPASCLTYNIFVVEETPGIHDSMPDNEITGHLIFITDRVTCWAEAFL